MNKKVVFKKIFLVLILVCMSIIVTACDFSNPNNGGYTPTVPSPGGSNTRPTPQVDNFPAIPVHKQSKPIPDEELLGSDFFSSKNNYFNIGENNRYVDLKKNTTIYVRYEENLHNEVKQELEVVIEYFRNILTQINPSYELILDTGTPLFLDFFVHDTVYIKNPDKKVLNVFSQSNALGATFFKGNSSPVVYINKSNYDVVINGKRIKLAQVLLHEIMHGFGFGHTSGSTDLLSPFRLLYEKNAYGKYYYRLPGTKDRIYIEDYFFLNNDEIAGIIQYLAPNKSFSQKASLYKSLGGTLPDFDSKLEEMKSSFISNTRNQSVSKKSQDILLENQIVSIKDKTNTYEIILNRNGVGSYTGKLSNGTTFTGKSKIIKLSNNGLTNQIIVLTDFMFEGKTRDITLYAIRKKDGEFYQRWKAYDSGVNLVFADNTANYFK